MGGRREGKGVSEEEKTSDLKEKQLAREGRELRKIVRRELRKEKALEGHWKCKEEREWKGSPVMRFIT